jgi:hypothetical protein
MSCFIDIFVFVLFLVAIGCDASCCRGWRSAATPLYGRCWAIIDFVAAIANSTTGGPVDVFAFVVATCRVVVSDPDGDNIALVKVVNVVGDKVAAVEGVVLTVVVDDIVAVTVAVVVAVG